MKIKIFSESESNFTGYGLGPLPDALSCTVTEERNGAFDLDMVYPIDGINYDKIQVGRILFCKARPSDTVGEPFRIYNLETGLVGVVNVHAHHLYYDLNSEVFLGELNTVKTTIASAVSCLNNHRANNSSIVRINYDNVADPISFNVGNIKLMSEAVAGNDDSLLSVVNGELKYAYDPLNHVENVYICGSRGQQLSYTIRYGRNMTEFDREEDNSEQVSVIIAYIEKEENGTVSRQTETFTLASVPHPKYMLVDVSSECEWGSTRAQMQTAVTKILNGRDMTQVNDSITASFVPSKTVDIDENQINLCDTLYVRYDDVGVTSVLMKIVKVIFNVLTGHYDKVELGSIRQNVADTIARMEKKAEYKKPSMTIVTDNVPYLTRATAADSVLEMLNKIVGATVAWNQRVQNGNFNGNTTGWSTIGTAARTVSNNVLTIVSTAVNATYQTLQLANANGHRILFCGTVSATASANFGIYKNSSGVYATAISPADGTKVRVASIITLSATSTDVFDIRFRANTAGSTTITAENINVFDLTLMFGSAIADYIYSLEHNTPGAGVAFFRSIFGKDYYQYDAGTLQSVKTSAHVTKDGNGNVLGSYPIQNIDVRGLMKLSDGKIVYDGDEYASNGTVTRKYGIVDLGTLTYTKNSGAWRAKISDRKYAGSGGGYIDSIIVGYAYDYNLGSDMTYAFSTSNNGYVWFRNDTYTTADAFKTAMSGHYLIYTLATPTTESASAYTQSQICDPNGSEEFIDGRDAEIPVGHSTDYIVVK